MVSISEQVDLGEIVLSTEVAKTVDALSISLAVRKHRFRNWGLLSPVEKAINDRVVTGGLFSIHRTTKDQEFWIITVPGTKGNHSSVLVRSYELKESAKWGCDDVGDGEEASEALRIDAIRWSVVRAYLEWGGDSPMSVLQEVSAFEEKILKDRDEVRFRSNIQKFLKPHRGVISEGFEVHIFFQTTAERDERPYLKIFADPGHESVRGYPRAGVLGVARLIDEMQQQMRLIRGPHPLYDTERGRLNVGWG